MPIFQKSLPKLLADATAATAKLTQRLADAEIAVADNRKAAEGLALAGADDAKLDEAEAKTRASVDRVATLKAALAQSEAAVGALERERDEQADRALREKTSTETEALARRVTEGCAKLISDAEALADWTSRAAAVVPESAGVLNFCQIISREIPQASELIAKLLRVHAASVIAGHAAAQMPVPPPAYVPPQVEPKPPTMTLFTTHSVKWTDDAGKLRTAAQFVDVTLPLKAARRGIQLKVLVQLNDPLRKQYNRGAAGSVADRPEHALDLDEPEQPKLVEPIMQSTPPTFTVVDRGGPIPMRVATRSETS